MSELKINPNEILPKTLKALCLNLIRVSLLLATLSMMIKKLKDDIKYTPS